MEKSSTTTIMRRSIFTFLQNLHHFTSTPSLLAFPFALSTLFSQPLVSSSPLFPSLHSRLTSLFVASGFPPSSELFPILNLKLTQTLLSFILVLPFTLSFLLLSKASVIRALSCHFKPSNDNKQNNTASFFSWITMLNPLLVTQFCNSLVILSANSTSFCLLIMSFDIFDLSGLSSYRNGLLLLSATGAIFYSIVVAHAYVVCNMSLIVSGVEKQGGFGSILKACVMIRGRIGTALSLAVVMNMALAGIEALFQYRVVRTYYDRGLGMSLSVILEGMFIAYMYAMLVVIDTIVGCVFLKSCIRGYDMDRIENQERNDHEMSFWGKGKVLEFLV